MEKITFGEWKRNPNFIIFLYFIQIWWNFLFLFFSHLNIMENLSILLIIFVKNPNKK